MEFEKVCGLVDGVGEKVWCWLWCAAEKPAFSDDARSFSMRNSLKTLQ